MREHRRRPRHLPPAVRRAARVRHRQRSPATCRAGSARPDGHRRRRRATRPTPSPPRSARRARWPRSSCRPTSRWREGAEPEPPAAGRGGAPQWPTTPSTSSPRRCARASRPRSSSAATRCARPGCVAAGRIAGATGAKLLCETFPARLERGAGLPAVERLGYLAEFAIAQLDGTAPPRARRREGAGVVLRLPGQAERARARRLRGARPRNRQPTTRSARSSTSPTRSAPTRRPAVAAASPARPADRRLITGAAVADALGALLPEGAIVSDEANTGGLWVAGATAGAPRHDWLTLTGGAIGLGMPVATGAAVACPDRPVINLEADGSAMYTLQALWTQAREGLDVTTVDLRQPLLRDPQPRAQPGRRRKRRARRRSTCSTSAGPTSTSWRWRRAWACRRRGPPTAEELTDQLERALAADGPALVEAMLPAGL